MTGCNTFLRTKGSHPDNGFGQDLDPGFTRHRREMGQTIGAGQSLFSLTAYRGSNGPGKFLLSKVT